MLIIRKQIERRQTFNNKYRAVFTTRARYIDCVGGRAAGRSHFGTDYFLFLITQPAYFRGCFLRNVFGDIRDSVFQDFKDRLDSSDFPIDDFEINESKMTVRHKLTGNMIISKGFKKSSGNRSAKLKSLAGITHVLIEEADENAENDFNKLDDSIRTNKIENIQVILLHNPPGKNHWICRRFYNLTEWDPLSEGDTNPDAKEYYQLSPKENPDLLVIHTNYRDNIKNLNSKTIKKYEAYGDPESNFYNPEYYYVDVKGLIPEGVKGRIYKNWKPITLEFFKSLPYESYYGLDFGYSDDPVALVEIKSHNNKNFFREIIYEPGLTNPALAELMILRSVSNRARIFPDSAEPKSIQELKDLGYRQMSDDVDKGPDSVNFGIKALKSMQNYYTQESKNLISENQEYKWHLDADGMPTDKPSKGNDHLMDAIRYGVVTYRGLKRKNRINAAGPRSSTSSPLDYI
jgi:phage terminase large subunit